MVKIGDKVRFLNSVGGGVVRSFKGKNMVMVEDESGFDFPALITECVVVGESNEYNMKLAAKPEVVKPVAEPEPEPEEVFETPEGEKLNVFLAFLPLDPKVITQSGYEAYLINESNYFLYVNYMNRENNSWVSRYHGLVEPNMRIFLEEFDKTDLNLLERVCVQFIAYKKDKPFQLKNAVSVELRLDTVKFYKQHCFMPNDFFEEDALVYPVVVNDLPEREMLVSSTELQEAMNQKIRMEAHAPQPLMRKQHEKSIIEVDLHIDQLLDNTAGMNNADMLNYQLDKFREVMNREAGHAGQKIVFIHGKGDGVLRSAIEKELKTNYKQHLFQDASFREYGYGATMVTIRNQAHGEGNRKKIQGKR